MATVFMRWLERSPEMYDRGIQLLTLGRLKRMWNQIASRYVRPGMRVLEIGCGTGTLAGMLADVGAEVTGIDLSADMLAQAEEKLVSPIQRDQVTLLQMDAAAMAEHFEPGSFDLIVSTLVFSELSRWQLVQVLKACRYLLSPEGRLLIVDEAKPGSDIGGLLYAALRLPLALVTWLLTRTGTLPLRHFDEKARHAGFAPEQVFSLLAGTLVMFECRPTRPDMSDEETSLPAAIPLSHQPSLSTFLVAAWALVFRIIPPYPKFEPGLYAIGRPGPSDPVLVTGNFRLTVHRLLRAVDGRLRAWLVVADSAGINVWCAAGGGYLTAEKVIAALRSSRLEQMVEHRKIILPQLCANGVDGWHIRQETGWEVHWGPVQANDIPAYIGSGLCKSDDMRWMAFPLLARLEMVTVTLGFYGLLILLPVFLFWRHLFLPVTLALCGLSYVYAVLLPWLPGRDGLLKSIPLALMALTGLLIYAQLSQALTARQLFNWVIALTGLSLFVGAEFQGMSPLMRGEQSNWSWEAVIGVVLGLVYWLGLRAFGFQ